jgi:hypothetical protein
MISPEQAYYVTCVKADSVPDEVAHEAYQIMLTKCKTPYDREGVAKHWEDAAALLTRWAHTEAPTPRPNF